MTKNDKKYIKVIKIILIIIWMIVVFIFSNQGGNESSGTSSKITKVVVDIVTKDKKESNNQMVEMTEKIVRKGAHDTIYTIGGFLIMNYTYSMEKAKKQKVLGSFLFGIFYAVTDEIHQYFIPGRSARLFDVGIDTFGVLTGICIYLAIMAIIDKLSKKHIDVLN